MKSLLVIPCLILLFGCRIVILPSAKWEKVDKFKVDIDTRPSELISKYLNDTTYLSKRNYFLTFFDIYCATSYNQMPACNHLYQETKDHFEWIAITIYDSSEMLNARQKLKYDSNYRYQYNKTYYGINGLKSSLRNLYYQNNVKIRDYVPMNFIISNDTIVSILFEPITSKEKHDEYKILLDSISKASPNLY